MLQAFSYLDVNPIHTPGKAICVSVIIWYGGSANTEIGCNVVGLRILLVFSFVL